MKNNDLNFLPGVIISSLVNTLNSFIQITFCTGGVSDLILPTAQLILVAILLYLWLTK